MYSVIANVLQLHIQISMFPKPIQMPPLFLISDSLTQTHKTRALIMSTVGTITFWWQHIGKAVHHPLKDVATMILSTLARPRRFCSTLALSSSSSPFVACNIYVSAGALPSHARWLMDILRSAQAQSHPGEMVVVHAYTDTVYNRSSFHVAGLSEAVSHVATHVATSAIQALRHERQSSTGSTPIHSHNDTQNQDVTHPFVGMVDHIAVMPLFHSDSDEATTNPQVDANKSSSNIVLETSLWTPTTVSGMCARRIGEELYQSQCIDHVLYYGTAHPEGTPLARVRKEHTSFFHSGGLAVSTIGTPPSRNVATIGAPLEFAENYNIRLTSQCSRRVAQSLTRRVRERNGGLPGVEAVTLPYSHHRWEVACNLLRPSVASSDDIVAIIQAWEAEQVAAYGGGPYVETAYRVGTTAIQCQQVLSYSAEELKEHNTAVQHRLQEYCQKQ
jgi:hypothetical protein